MTEFEKIKMMSEFSKGLTLWGSNKVVKIQKSNYGKHESRKLLNTIRRYNL